MTKNNKPTIEMIPVQYWAKMYTELTEHFTAKKVETESLKQTRNRLMQEIDKRNEQLEAVNVLIEDEEREESKRIVAIVRKKKVN